METHEPIATVLRHARLAGHPDRDRSWSLILRKGVIAHIGADEDIEDRVGPNTADIDLRGRTVAPGFCDAHLHLMLSAEQSAQLDCADVRAVDQLCRRVADAVGELPPGAWLSGFGWERQHLFAEAWPTIDCLDRAAPNNPVILTSKDAHSAWLNSAALASLDALPSRPAKVVVQRVDGQPTGMIFEDVIETRAKLLPPRSPAEKEAMIERYLPELHALGITSVHTNEPPENWPVIRRVLAGEHAPLRVLCHAVLNSPEDLTEQLAPLRIDQTAALALGGVKLFLDGSFGSLTAALSQPYTETDDIGILNMDDEELLIWLGAIHKAESHAVAHAIGDRAVEQALRCFASLDWPAATTNRIEHAQLLSRHIVDEHDLSRVAFSVQPSHMWGDRAIVGKKLSPELGQRWAYPLRTMRSRARHLVFGSDSPIEHPSPWRGIVAAITRLEDADNPPWIADQRLELAEALEAHTLAPARLTGNRFNDGALEVGKAANVVVFERDPYEIADRNPRALLSEVEVAMTFVDGRLVYQRETQ